MEKETREKFIAKLKAVCDEFGVENVSIAGTCHNKCIGTLGVDKGSRMSLGLLFETVANVGRLWQHSRTVVRDSLDDFEKLH